MLIDRIEFILPSSFEGVIPRIRPRVVRKSRQRSLPPRFELHTKAKSADFEPPARTIPRSIGHANEWLQKYDGLPVRRRRPISMDWKSTVRVSFNPNSKV